MATLGQKSDPQAIFRLPLSYAVVAVFGMLGLVAGTGTANAQPAPWRAVTGVGPPITYGYWTLPDPGGDGYHRLYQTVTPSNVPVPGQGQASPAYFYAMQWYNASNLSVGGYLGLQTDDQGKKAIFSWWGGIKGRGPGISRAFSGEGTGWQTIIPYDWQAHRTYRLNVNHSATTSTGVWFTATVLDIQANQSSTIGSIEIPASFGGIYPAINNFVEWYGPAQAGCANYPLSDVTFSAPRGREQVGSTTTLAVAGNPPSATPDGPACSAVTNAITSMEHINGTP